MTRLRKAWHALMGKSCPECQARERMLDRYAESIDIVPLPQALKAEAESLASKRIRADIANVTKLTPLVRRRMLRSIAK